MRSITRVLVTVSLLALVTTAAQAQRRPRPRARAAAVAVVPRPHLGGHVGYNFDVEELLLGAQLSYPITPRLDLYPTFDYYFIDPGSLWALNLDVKYRPPTRYGAFYVGGGLDYSRSSVSGTNTSDTNLNLLAGWEGRRRRTWPYFEARLILGDGSSFQLAGGLSWGI